MKGHRIGASLTRAVRTVTDLIVAKFIVVLDSNLKGCGFGSLSCCYRLDSLRWWLIFTSIGVEGQEGESSFAFFLSSFD